MAHPDQAFRFSGDASIFIENYKAMVDEVSHWNNKPAIIIWGFFRDSHGGEDAAKEVADYAAERGIRILPGVGTSGYGGVYYEGAHRYSAKSMMEKYPELVTQNQKIDQSGSVRRGATLNPLNPRVIEWLAEGIDWLFTKFPVAGVNLEMGDFFVAQDPVSTEQRKKIHDVGDEFFKMLALQYGSLIAELNKKHPDKEISYATYSDFSTDILQRNHAFSRYIPNTAVSQWTLTHSQEFTDRSAFLPSRNRGYSHLFSTANRTHESDLREQIAKTCTIASLSRFEGVAIYGEIGMDSPYARVNYEAFQEFTANPASGRDRFGIGGSPNGVE